MGAAVLLLVAVNLACLALLSYRAWRFERLQSELIASVSHELRAPLSVLLSAGENIRDGIVASEDLQRYGALIVGQSRTLMSQADRLLLSPVAQRREDSYALRPLELPEILLYVRDDLSEFLSTLACVLELKIEPDLPLVIGDPQAIIGCIQNLLTNAAKYSGEERRVVLSAGVRRKQDGTSEVAISVEDHGLGIRRSELKRIFKPFYRSSDVIAAGIQGTGLGLAIAKRLAEAMGGGLTVASELRIGSVFTLHLRAAECEHVRFRAGRAA